MALQRIDVDSSIPRQTLRVVTEKGIFGLRLFWVERMASWFMDVRDADGSALLSGIRIAVGVDLFGRFRARDGVPQVHLFALNLAEAGVEISHRAQLGQDVKLFLLPDLAE